MNILVISNGIHTDIGGIEIYNRLLFDHFSDFSFYEISYCLTDVVPNSLFKNVHILTPIKGIKEKVKSSSKIPKWLLNSKNILISRVITYITQKSYSNVVSAIFSKLISEYSIDRIIWTSGMFFNRRFIRKFRNMIIFVQHQNPYNYMPRYMIDYENSLPCAKYGFFDFYFKRNGRVKYNYFKFMRNIVCFDQKNKSIIEKLYRKKRIFDINIPSRYLNDCTNLPKVEKKYDFISPIRLWIEKNPVALCSFASKSLQYKFFICGNDTDYFKIPKTINIDSDVAIDACALRLKYLQSKFLLLFSYFEGSPIVISEAFSLGLPCIIANTFPSAEYLVGSNSERGFLFDLYDENHAEKIKNFVENCNYESLSNNVLKFAKHNLSLKTFYEKWRKVLEVCK